MYTIYLAVHNVLCCIICKSFCKWSSHLFSTNFLVFRKPTWKSKFWQISWLPWFSCVNILPACALHASMLLKHRSLIEVQWTVRLWPHSQDKHKCLTYKFQSILDFLTIHFWNVINVTERIVENVISVFEITARLQAETGNFLTGMSTFSTHPYWTL